MLEIDLPRQGGTYILLLTATSPGCFPIGKLGVLHLRPGLYLYVGSAQGPGGLRARVNRHLRSSLAPARRHWHIDHLLACAQVREVWYARSSQRFECDWAQALAAQRGAVLPLARFGASDCACPGHLLHVSAEAALPRLLRAVRAKVESASLRVERVG